MPRLYKRSLAKAGRTITPEDFNYEESAIAIAADSLDGHNMPCGTITVAKVAERVLDDAGDPLIISTGPFTDYYECYQQGSTVSTALIDLDLRTDNTNAGWTSLYDEGITAAKQTISDMSFGVLEGEFFVDYEKRYGYHSSTNRGGHNDWVEFCIFLDGQEWKRSGPLYARRDTPSFNVFELIHGGSHEIEIKFRHGRIDTNSSNTQYAGNFKIYSAGFFLKNRKR